MLNTTQIAWVQKTLRKNKRITRNQCLQKYISRLGAIIHRLKKDGWQFRGGYIEAPMDGLDYEYRLVKAPKLSTSK